MSQWVQKTQKVLDDIKMSTFEKALAEMGFRLDSRTNVSNSWGNDYVDRGMVKVEGGTELPIGFVFREESGKTSVELRGDFFATGLRENTFLNEVAQMYQKHNVTEQLENQGWSIDNIEMNEKKEIVIDAYQWA